MARVLILNSIGRDTATCGEFGLHLPLSVYHRYPKRFIEDVARASGVRFVGTFSNDALAAPGTIEKIRGFMIEANEEPVFVYVLAPIVSQIEHGRPETFQLLLPTTVTPLAPLLEALEPAAEVGFLCLTLDGLAERAPKKSTASAAESEPKQPTWFFPRIGQESFAALLPTCLRNKRTLAIGARWAENYPNYTLRLPPADPDDTISAEKWIKGGSDLPIDDRGAVTRTIIHGAHLGDAAGFYGGSVEYHVPEGQPRSQAHDENKPRPVRDAPVSQAQLNRRKNVSVADLSKYCAATLMGTTRNCLGVCFGAESNTVEQYWKRTLI